MLFTPISFVFFAAVAMFLEYRMFLRRLQPPESELVKASHGAAFAVLTCLVFWKFYGAQVWDHITTPEGLGGMALIALGCGWLITGVSRSQSFRDSRLITRAIIKIAAGGLILWWWNVADGYLPWGLNEAAQRGPGMPVAIAAGLFGLVSLYVALWLIITGAVKLALLLRGMPSMPMGIPMGMMPYGDADFAQPRPTSRARRWLGFGVAAAIGAAAVGAFTTSTANVTALARNFDFGNIGRQISFTLSQLGLIETAKKEAGSPQIKYSPNERRDMDRLISQDEFDTDERCNHIDVSRTGGCWALPKEGAHFYNLHEQDQGFIRIGTLVEIVVRDKDLDPDKYPDVREFMHEKTGMFLVEAIARRPVGGRGLMRRSDLKIAPKSQQPIIRKVADEMAHCISEIFGTADSKKAEALVDICYSKAAVDADRYFR